MFAIEILLSFLFRWTSVCKENGKIKIVLLSTKYRNFRLATSGRSLLILRTTKSHRFQSWLIFSHMHYAMLHARADIPCIQNRSKRCTILEKRQMCNVLFLKTQRIAQILRYQLFLVSLRRNLHVELNRYRRLDIFSYSLEAVLISNVGLNRLKLKKQNKTLFKSVLIDHEVLKLLSRKDFAYDLVKHSQEFSIKVFFT